MATFRLTDPAGAEYEVDAPNEHQAVAALKQVNAPRGGTTLNIEGRKVTVDDSFLKLSPDQQNATVDEIHKSLSAGTRPIHIGAPDGSTVEFPAGTTDDTIKAAMGKAYPPPKGNAHSLDELGKALANAHAAGDVDAARALAGEITRMRQPASAAPEPKSAIQSIREALHAPTRALENGVLLGLGDRARAGMAAIIGDGSYGANLKREQDETEQFSKDHPIAAPVIEGVGGAVAPIGAIAAASKATGLGTKMLYGAGAGGGIGAGQGALASKDWTDLPQVGKDAALGGIIGGAVGGAIPAAGKVIGAGYNAVANAARGRVDGMSRAGGSHLISAMEADGPAVVQQRMQELGPDAMLADAGPAFLGKAQGASLNSDEGRSILQNTLTRRNEGTNARIMGDVNRALGPAEDPQTVTNAIKAHRTAVDSVNYPAALDNAPPVKIAPVMIHLLDKIDQTPTGSMERKALEKLQDMLTKTKKEPMVDAGGYPVYDKFGNERFRDVPYSHDEAHILHKVKQELDNVIEYDAPGLGVPAGALSRQQAALKEMRHAINQTLEMQVPGYTEANRASAALAKRGDAVELGTQYLGSGKTTASPERFAADFEPLSPGEKIAFAKGSRGNIERVLGTKANDLQALRTELQGEGGWNGAKIATVHGEPAANELTASVDRNLKFRDTHNKVVENSQTAMRESARDAMKPVAPGETPLVNPSMSITGFLATGAKKAANAALSAVRPDPTRHYGEVAKALTEQGPARDARIDAIIAALKKRQGNAALSSAAGDRTALVAAVGTNSYARRRD